jgi:hypothetical protein
LAQSYGLSLIATALKRGQFFLVAEILRFLIPPRESSSGLVQWGPAGPPTPLAAAAEAPGVITSQQQQQQQLQKQPSADKTPASAAGSSSSGWFGWLWGSSGSGNNAGQQQQRHHPQGSGPGGSPKASAGSLSAASQYRQSLAGGPAHSNGDWHGLSGSVSAAGAGAAAAAADGVGGFAPGADACRVVAEKGWALLGQVRGSWVGQGGLQLVCHVQQSAGVLNSQQV